MCRFFPFFRYFWEIFLGDTPSAALMKRAVVGRWAKCWLWQVDVGSSSHELLFNCTILLSSQWLKQITAGKGNKLKRMQAQLNEHHTLKHFGGAQDTEVVHQEEVDIMPSTPKTLGWPFWWLTLPFLPFTQLQPNLCPSFHKNEIIFSATREVWHAKCLKCLPAYSTGPVSPVLGVSGALELSTWSSCPAWPLGVNVSQLLSYQWISHQSLRPW